MRSHFSQAVGEKVPSKRNHPHQHPQQCLPQRHRPKNTLDMSVPASVMDSQHIRMTQILADCLFCPNFSETEKLSVTGHVLKSRLIMLPCRIKQFVSNSSHRFGAICWPTGSSIALFSKQKRRAHELVLALKLGFLDSWKLYITKQKTSVED